MSNFIVFGKLIPSKTSKKVWLVYTQYIKIYFRNCSPFGTHGQLFWRGGLYGTLGKFWTLYYTVAIVDKFYINISIYKEVMTP